MGNLIKNIFKKFKKEPEIVENQIPVIEECIEEEIDVEEQEFERLEEDLNLKQNVIEKLKKVIDPETGEDIISMELIKNLKVYNNGKVSLKFRPSAYVCPLAFQLAFEIKKTILNTDGINNVKIKVIDFFQKDELNKMLREENSGI